jgi:hypothetical protein
MTHNAYHHSRFPSEEWQHVSSFATMGPTPQQGTPTETGVDCGIFTLLFAMEISLGRSQFDFGQIDIPRIRNWMTHNMINLGKQNETYVLSRLPTLQEGGRRPTDTHKHRMKGEGGSKQKVSKQDPMWRIPGAPPPRDITNPGGQYAINVPMQLYFHIPSITSIPGLQQIQDLKSNLDRYSTGEGQLMLGHLYSIFPQSTKTSAQDVGEILDKIATLIPEDQEGLPFITHLDPETSLYSSLQKCQTWNYSQGDGDENTFIFQINRVSLKGQKITSNMTYPRALDLQKCQSSKGQKTGTHHFLKAMVVHTGSSVNKGHYVVYIQPANSRNWALFDDQIVSWVQEEEVLHQRATLLIYSRQPPPTLSARTGQTYRPWTVTHRTS